MKAYTGNIRGEDVIVIEKDDGDTHVFVKKLVCDLIPQTLEQFLTDITTKSSWMMSLFPSDPLSADEQAALTEVAIPA